MVLLGSTGSIGVNTLAIARRYNLPVEVLVAGRNGALLQQQIDAFSPRVVVVSDEATAQQIRHPDVRFGEEAILQAIEESQSDLVVNALVGFLGLRPTMAALASGKRVALANKESLVAAGAFLDTSRIHPIDSEHFGLWYLLVDRPITKMTITASGGAFRDWPLEKIADATLEQVLQHPNWSMGQKITIDSATMVNKMFELLEGYWLFKDRFAQRPHFDAVIETKSLIHALVDFADGSSTAHFARADMQLPIAFALIPEVMEPIVPPCDLIAAGGLEFRAITPDRYPVWEAKTLLLDNPRLGTVLNAANEAAIERFLSGKTNFGGIGQTILTTLKAFEKSVPSSIEEVFTLDREVRTYAATL